MKPLLAALLTFARAALYSVLASVYMVWLLAPEAAEAVFYKLLPTTLCVFLIISLVARRMPRQFPVFQRSSRIGRLVAINSLVFLLSSEIALRALGKHWDSSLLLPPEASAERLLRAWRGRPHGSFHDHPLNSLGFFDEEFQRERQSPLKRVAVLADSFGVGVVPYEQNYLTLLDDLLDKCTPTEVLNFSVRSIGLPEYLYLYQSEARYYSPDLVLVCIFVGNDIENRARPSFLTRFLDRDNLYTWTVMRRMVLVASGSDVRTMAPDEPSFDLNTYMRIEWARLQLATRDLQRTVHEASYEFTYRYIAALSAAIGSKLRVAILPDEFQINDTLYDALSQICSTSGFQIDAAFDRTSPNRRLAQFLTASRIPFLDLTGEFQAAGKRERLYKRRDTHWNREGNRLAATVLGEWLAEELTVQERHYFVDRGGR